MVGGTNDRSPAPETRHLPQTGAPTAPDLFPRAERESRKEGGTEMGSSPLCCLPFDGRSNLRSPSPTDPSSSYAGEPSSFDFFPSGSRTTRSLLLLLSLMETVPWLLYAKAGDTRSEPEDGSDRGRTGPKVAENKKKPKATSCRAGLLPKQPRCLVVLVVSRRLFGSRPSWSRGGASARGTKSRAGRMVGWATGPRRSRATSVVQEEVEVGSGAETKRSGEQR